MYRNRIAPPFDLKGVRRRSPAKCLKPIQPFRQLDVRAPGIGEVRNRNPQRGNSPERDIELDTSRLQLLAVRFQVLYFEADMIEGPSFCSSRRAGGRGKGQINAGQIGGLERTALTWLRFEHLHVPGFGVRDRA